MGTEPAPRRMAAATAERLLQGEPVAGYERLSQLLAAAAAPAEPNPADQALALRAFRAARRAPAPRPRRVALTKPGFARFLTLKATVILVTASGVGGVTVFAATGNLPDPAPHPTPGSTTTESERILAESDSDPQQRPITSLPQTNGPLSGQSNGEHPQSQHEQSRPEPLWPGRDAPVVTKLDALCSKYLAGDRSAAVLNNDADFRELINQVGSREQERIERFCTDLQTMRRHPYQSWTWSFPQPSGMRFTRPTTPPAGRSDGDPPAR